MHLEDDNLCAVCGCRVSGSVAGIPRYFCDKCYKEYGLAILADEQWVHYLLNSEKQRRKRRNGLLHQGYILICWSLPRAMSG